MLYGRELWGMSPSRANIIRNRVWKAYKLIFGFKNVAYDSVSDEFGIERIEIQACKSRIRALKKYKMSKTIISDIMCCEVASRKTTWSSRSIRWIKRVMCLQPAQLYGMNLKELYEMARDVYLNRKSHNRSSSSKMRENLKLRKLNFPSLLVDVKSSDLYKYVLLRIGRVVWTNELVSRKKISETYADYCVLCSEQVLENTKHFVLECYYLNSVREEFKVQLSKLKDISSSANELLGCVFGNKTSVLNPEEEKAIQIDMVQMISKMLLIRSIRVSNEASMVPT
ncbi:hypothetical protein NGRA_3366 [Nosema granulosis]|uniref:Uncharacterized protein n=1 Tax=Nosema granulosis TaxID=83296 RepID=A0A9P6GVY2_9MICR|nr:hypothetical protein NGRA_3366 [Nosema granulosis]